MIANPLRFAISTPLAVIVGLAVASSASACDYCEKEVTLNRDLARCYLDRYEKELKLLKDLKLPAQLVNLAVCDGVKSETRGASGIPGKRGKKPTIQFLLDDVGLTCLAKTLTAAAWSDESALTTFEVPRDCG